VVEKLVSDAAYLGQDKGGNLVVAIRHLRRPCGAGVIFQGFTTPVEKHFFQLTPLFRTNVERIVLARFQRWQLAENALTGAFGVDCRRRRSAGETANQ